MIKNILITTIRSISRSAFTTFLSVTGLAIAFASALLIAQYVIWERSFDAFHERTDRIARVSFQFHKNGELNFHTAATFARVGPALKEEYPQVLNSCRIVPIYKGGVIENESSLHEIEHIYYSDHSFFDMFGFPMSFGMTSHSFKGPNKAVISMDLASRMSLNDPIGKRIEVNTRDGKINCEIVGVIDPQKNSHMQFDMLLSYETLIQRVGMEAQNGWSWFDFITYLEFDHPWQFSEFPQNFPGFIDKHGGDRLGSDKVKFILQPIKDIHLTSNIRQELSSNGDERMVNFLSAMGLMIMVIAWANYNNLATSNLSRREKEISIKKIIGSSKITIQIQLLFETLVINFISLFIGLILFYFSLPYLSELTGQYITNTFFGSVYFWLAVLVGIILNTLICGIYPAILLSYSSIFGQQKSSSKQNKSSIILRKGLVIFQFAISCALITGTLIVYSQMEFMMSQDTGLDTSDVMCIPSPDYLGNQLQFENTLSALKTELSTHSAVQSVTSSSVIPGMAVDWYGGASRVSSSEQQERNIIYKMTLDKSYLDVVKAPFLAGSNFRRNSDSTYIILNKLAMEMLGFKSAESAVNEQVYMASMDTFTVIGVVDNFHQESLSQQFKPTAYLLMDEEISYLSVKLKSPPTTEFIEYVENTFHQHLRMAPFEYFLLDDYITDQYAGEQQFLSTFSVFSILAIIIAVMGLIGLSFFSTQLMVKEIGIRKVLGARVSNIFVLCSNNVLKSVMWGNIIVIPITYYLAVNWLSNFPFHIEFNWFIILITLVISLLAALASTSYHIIKIAIINPVITLRSQ